VGLCLLLYLGYCVPLIPVAADDVRMAGVFSLDESATAQVIQRMHGSGSLDVPSFKYGGGFYYPVLAAAFLWDIAGAVTERFILLAMRGLGTLAGLGCLWLTYRLGCVVSTRLVGLVGALLLGMTPTFLRWSVEGHPDLPQLFWILCCLTCCVAMCRGLSLKQTMLASIFAGLAFGTKYAGGFLLPVIAASALLPSADGHFSLRTGLDRLRNRTALIALGSIPAFFIVGFAVTNPFALARLGEFIHSLEVEREIMAFGHTSRVDVGGLAWLWLLADVAGRANAVILALSLAAGSWYVVRRRRLASISGILLVWIALFLGYLVLESSLRRTRHLLPVLPVLFVFLAQAYRAIWAEAKGRLPGRSVVHLILPLLILGLSWGRLAATIDLFEQK
jgi:4-amino-4-deoxy-L-arabinose transferase-like glycosyltransferase